MVYDTAYGTGDHYKPEEEKMLSGSTEIARPDFPALLIRTPPPVCLGGLYNRLDVDGKHTDKHLDRHKQISTAKLCKNGLLEFSSQKEERETGPPRFSSPGQA